MRDPKSIAIVSSGDADKDRADIDKFCRESDLIDAGMCPNGCGGMGTVDPYNAICLKCGFMYFCSGGLPIKDIPTC